MEVIYYQFHQSNSLIIILDLQEILLFEVFHLLFYLLVLLLLLLNQVIYFESIYYLIIYTIVNLSDNPLFISSQNVCANPITLLSSSVLPKASKIGSFFALLSPLYNELLPLSPVRV